MRKRPRRARVSWESGEDKDLLDRIKLETVDGKLTEKGMELVKEWLKGRFVL